MSTNRVIVLADVDGQFNDFATPEDERLVEFEANGYKIRFDPSVLDRVVDLHNEGVFEVQWLTTWGDDANVFLRKEFGFSEDLVVADTKVRLEREENAIGSALDPDWQPWRHRGEWWKSQVVRELLQSDKSIKVIWLDDELGRNLPFLGTHSADLRWMRRVTPDRLLAISTWPTLSHVNMNTIEAWLG